MSETSVGDPQLPKGKSVNMFARAIKKIPSAIFRRPSPNLTLETPLPEEPPVSQELYPSPNRLKTSQGLIFHTAPMDQVDSIINRGLFAVEIEGPAQQIMGENLAYSLYFPIEREANRRRIDPVQIPDAILDNYALTIWQRNPSVARVESRAQDSIGHNQITAKTTKSIPEGYFTSAEADSDALKWLISLDPSLVRNLSSNNLMAAVQIDRSTREELLKLMILASQGKVHAVSIEEQIKAQLEGGKIKYLKEGISVGDISFELASTIERELMRSIIMPYMDLSRKDSSWAASANTHNGQKIQDRSTPEAFGYALAFRLNVNDAVTARYLDGCIKELEQTMKSQGVDTDKLKKQVLSDIQKEKDKPVGIKTTSTSPV